MQMFSIDNKSGVIHLQCGELSDMSLDREAWSFHSLTVQATDSAGNLVGIFSLSSLQ